MHADDGQSVKYYRHKVGDFDFAQSDGVDRFQVYNFVRNLYNVFVPRHLERIQKAAVALTIAKEAGSEQIV